MSIYTHSVRIAQQVCLLSFVDLFSSEIYNAAFLSPTLSLSQEPPITPTDSVPVAADTSTSPIRGPAGFVPAIPSPMMANTMVILESGEAAANPANTNPNPGSSSQEISNNLTSTLGSTPLFVSLAPQDNASLQNQSSLYAIIGTSVAGGIVAIVLIVGVIHAWWKRHRIVENRKRRDYSEYVCEDSALRFPESSRDDTNV